MTLNNVVALRGDFDARFPDMCQLGSDQDRVPGRDLAECVLAGLKEQGLEAEGPLYEEPFFELRCRTGARPVTVLCYIYEPKAETWVVEVVWKTGFFDWFARREDEPHVRTLVGALYQALARDRQVREMRWFSSLPASPFGNVSFAVSPLG
jgi:hypothetical protein